MTRRTTWALIAGVLIVAVLTVLTQFLTIGAVNVAVETAAPAGWVVGLIFSLVMATLLFRTVAGRRLLDQRQLTVLYVMLVIAVPVMNIGLVRMCVLAIYAPVREYLLEGNSTYRTTYNTLSPLWAPVIPDAAGLAWLRVERLLDFLEDPAVARRQREARRDFARTSAESDFESRRTLAAEMSMDDLAELLAGGGSTGSETWSSELRDLLQSELDRKAARSRESVAVLPEKLAGADEWVASMLPHNLAAHPMSARRRIGAELDRLGPEAAESMRREVAALDRRAPELASLISSLGAGDRAGVRRTLIQQELDRFTRLPAGAIASLAEGLVYRLSRAERTRLAELDGSHGPNQNIAGFRQSLWRGGSAQQAKERASLAGNVRQVFAELPWHLWWRPLTMWTLLFLGIFAVLMCLAEWLRRRWVEQENLAFPQVEIADHLIRHDQRLELASDITAPEPRRRPIYPLAIFGFAVGFLILSLEALGHYGILSSRPLLRFDFTTAIFSAAGGPLKEFPRTILVLSPIVIGLAYLLSLEVNFSIWFSFLLYSLAVWWAKLVLPEVNDSNFTGFALGGNVYPFPMEQFLGACACYTAYLLWKMRGTPSAGAESFVPPRLTRWLPWILLPLFGASFWGMGVTNVTIIAFVLAVLFAQTIAGARIRAETGLPVHHGFYELTKLPMILGLTGHMGAKSFAAFINIAFLPAALLFRSLSGLLESLELARRHRVAYRTVAVASLAAFVTAIGVGMTSFLVYSYYLGDAFYGIRALPPQGEGYSVQLGLSNYPLWVSHFLGEAGLASFDRTNWLRLGFVALGASVVALLLLLRRRFLRFPLHPVGYLVVLSSIFYTHVSPYFGSVSGGLRISDVSTIWGSIFAAWLIKKLIVKYGGMNAYKRGKPFFVSVVIGSVVAIFAWNVTDLVCSLVAAQSSEPGSVLKVFTQVTPFTPALY